MKKCLSLLTWFYLFSACAVFAAQDARDSDSPFGVLDFLSWDHEWNHGHYNGDKVEKAAGLMKEAGVAFVRMDFLWSDIEPVRGTFEFKKYDRIVEILSKKGIKILGLLDYNASWSSAHWNDAPNREYYIQFAEQVVKRYKKKIKYWEIWNEPDCKLYWAPQDDMKSYTCLLKEVYPVLKKVDPTCDVLLGGLSQNIPIQLRRIYEYGGRNFFDIVNIHPFADPGSANAMQMLKGIYLGVYKQMKDNGDAEKPIWFTELGCPGVCNPKEKGWWFGESPLEEKQAEWVETVYGEPLRWKGVKKIFWAFFRDTPNHFKNGVDYFGLVREDFSKKLGFESYKKAARTS